MYFTTIFFMDFNASSSMDSYKHKSKVWCTPPTKSSWTSKPQLLMTPTNINSKGRCTPPTSSSWTSKPQLLWTPTNINSKGRCTPPTSSSWTSTPQLLWTPTNIIVKVDVLHLQHLHGLAASMDSYKHYSKVWCTSPPSSSWTSTPLLLWTPTNIKVKSDVLHLQNLHGLQNLSF